MFEYKFNVMKISAQPKLLGFLIPNIVICS